MGWEQNSVLAFTLRAVYILKCFVYIYRVPLHSTAGPKACSEEKEMTGWKTSEPKLSGYLFNVNSFEILTFLMVTRIIPCVKRHLEN